jgi:hypothetical protein
VSDPTECLTSATNDDLASALAFALMFEGGKRTHTVDKLMAEIVVKRLVRYLERVSFVVMKRPPIGGSSAFRRGFERSRQRPENTPDGSYVVASPPRV